MHGSVRDRPAAQDRNPDVCRTWLGRGERRMQSQQSRYIFSDARLRALFLRHFLEQKKIGNASGALLNLLRNSLDIRSVCKIDRHHAGTASFSSARFRREHCTDRTNQQQPHPANCTHEAIIAVEASKRPWRSLRRFSLTYESIRLTLKNVPRPSNTRPTDSELEILTALWERGPSTVRELHDNLNLKKPTGYTTVLKFLQIMADKGLVRRREIHRAHVYEAALPQETTQSQLVRDLAARAFGGSPLQLAMRALATDRASAEELSEIRRLLDECERRAR
jgi:predicted transcriptional regulator